MVGGRLPFVRNGARRCCAALLVAAPVLAGCSGGLLGSSPSSSDNGGGVGGVAGQLSSFFLGVQPKTATQGVAGPDTDIDCPIMDVRNGASTLTVNADQKDSSANGLRYQVTIGRMARSCAIVGSNMQVKAGIQGRVILGPAGTPGEVEIPLRFAVVAEGPDPQTLATKLYRIPVTVAPDRTTAEFTHVDENLTFPLPRVASDLDSYVIYVGFDPTAVQPVEHKRPAPKKRRSS